MASKRLLYAFMVQVLAMQFLLATPSNSQNLVDVKISINAESLTLKEILDKVQEQTAFSFTYNQALGRDKQKFTFSLDGSNLRDLLQTLADSTDFGFKRVNQNIYVVKNKVKTPLAQSFQEGEEIVTSYMNIDISGTVSDENGNPIPGATVIVEGTNVGTVTDIDGKFSLNVDEGAVIRISYIGYQSQSLTVTNQSTYRIVMVEDQSSLEEVVVIGYGTQRRETVTGSIATIKSEDFNPGMIADPMTLITGKVAGLAITRPNGADPNATADFSLRGAVSREGSAQPLIVIDGVPGGDLRTVAPQDIEAIDVLKDGSAAAIYGSRATGGVILITTKRGKAGPAKISYSGYTSTERISKRYDVLNAEQYKNFAAQHGLEANDQGHDTDWFNELLRDFPVSHGHNLSVSGGNGKTDYFASVNFQDFEGMDLASSRRFVNGSFRLHTKALNDKLDFSAGLTNSFDTKSFAEYYGFGQALNMNPTFPVRNPDGSFFEAPQIGQGSQWNPVANTEYNTNDSREKRILGTASATYNFLPNLSVMGTYSFTVQDFLSGSYTDNNLLYMQQSGILGQASRNQNTTTNNVFEGLIDYQKEFDRHNFNLLTGYSYQNIFNEGFGAGNNNFNTNAFLYHNLGAGAALHNMTPGFVRNGVFMNSFANERTLVAYFGRLLYDFDEKYLFNASIRREGASVLGAANKWGTFYGISGGWMLSKESFLQGSNFVRNLKIRAGYGVTGNQDALNPYQSLATVGPFPWGTQHAYYGTPDNPNWVLSYGPNINPNPNLRWETKTEWNAGIDFTLFNSGWLTGSLDYYDRRIKDLIGNFTAQMPPNIFPMIFANAGEMMNQGFEVLLDARVIKRNNVSWNVTFVGARNINEIVSVSSDQFKGSAQNITGIGLGWGGDVQRLAPGQPVAVFYGRKFAGFDESGQWLFYDKDDNAVTKDHIGDDDFRYLGNSIPKYNFGLTNTFMIGRFDASMLIRGAFGFQALNAKRIFHDNINTFTSTNLLVSALDNPIRDQALFSDYYLENGNYVKLDNLTIGYTFPFKNLRVYTTGLNLLVLSDFSGMDPELAINPFNGAGVEFNNNYYPRTRTFTLGLSAQF
ncbi:SusC/RagA family TonB-linked outer membrane protein [Negadavirga shengliensis]|uniref:SusC/RagA family TonB-linked outer membrane protein n=1 Tax=Negadavirga shengliensis TaxID=1389218 RepID=A0ABV9SXB3_9BACT